MTKKTRKITLSLLFIICFFNAYTQELNLNYEDYNFSSPVDIPLKLAASFGELRPNHFHTGIDIKTEQRINLNVYSIEDGYVSRIRVSPYGYGHIVYIDHYNGLTSAYAHLTSFVGVIQQLAEEQQRKTNSFSIDYYPTKDSIKVKKGQIIAKSGNTGSSTAPHLHFEIRDTKTELALNPLLFNFDVKDTQSPIIRRVKIYALTEKGYRVPGLSKVIQVTGRNGVYRIAGDKITIPSNFTSKNGGIGLAFDVIDKFDESPGNIMGLHTASLFVDSNNIFSIDKSEISFYTNRYINSHLDYEAYIGYRNYYEKMFKTNRNPLPIYRNVKNNGIINVTPGDNFNINYEVKDAHNNTSALSFELAVGEGTSSERHILYPNKELLHPDSAYMYYDHDNYIFFPPGIIYEPTPLNIQPYPNRLVFGNSNIPVQDTYKVMMRIPENKWKSSLKDRYYYITRKNNTGGITPEGGAVKDGWITARTKGFGTFSVAVDSIPPTISARNFKNHSSVNGRQLWWYISDGQSGLKNYTIHIDDEWYLLEYEPKQSKFFFIPPKSLKGKREVIVRAEDKCGNSKEQKYILTF